MANLKIGDEVYIHGFVDEIRRDTVIIKNEGGYFGTATEEIIPTAQPDVPDINVGDVVSRQAVIDAIVAWTVEHRPDIEMPTDLVGRIKTLPSAQPERQWIPCSECMYWRDERVLMNDGKARQYNGDEPDALGIKHSVTTDVGINEGAKCLYEEDRGWSTDHTTFRNADDFCSRAKKRPCSYEEWYGIVDGVYAEPWRGEET